MGATPTRLKTPRELLARRWAYELDSEWYPDHGHVALTDRLYKDHPSQGGNVPIVRKFEDASPQIQCVHGPLPASVLQSCVLIRPMGVAARALIDPTYVPPGCVLPVGKQKGAHWASQSSGAARL